MKWTTFQHARDTDAVLHEGTRTEWAEFVCQTHGKGKDGLAISAAVFEPAKRKRANVREVWALMFDLDGHALPGEMYDEPPQHIAYTTWSHDTEKGECWRVLFPLQEPVTAVEYDALWSWANATYLDGLADEGAKDPSRLMYLAREDCPAGEPYFRPYDINAFPLKRSDYQHVLDAAKRKRDQERIRKEEYRKRMELQTDDERFGWVPDALQAIDPNCSYDVWRDIGFALRSAEAEGFADAERLFEQFSHAATVDTYDRGKLWRSKVWNSASSGNVTLGTLSYHAQDYGWEKPRKEYVQPDYDKMLERWKNEQAKRVERGEVRGHADTDRGLEDYQDRSEVHQDQPQGVDSGDDVAWSPEYITSTSDLGVSNDVLRALGITDGRIAWTGNAWALYQPRQGIFTEHRNVVYRYVANHMHGRPVLPPPDKEDADAKPWITTHNSRTNIEKTAIAMVEEQGKGFFDHQRPGLAFRNGFVCGVTGELEPHSQHNRARVQIPVHYDESAQAPTWEKTLATYFPDSQETRDLLEEFFGVCLLGYATKLGKSLFMLGEGSNGKSTLVGVVQSIFPPESCCSVSPHKMSAHNAEYWLIRLKGKLLNTVTDLSKRDLLDMGDFKAIVTGDEIAGRAPHREVEEFRPVAGHVILTNELPYVADASHGFWRRPVAVKFSKEFTSEEADTNIQEKLVAERAGVAARLIRAGMRAIKRGHYVIPEESADVLNEWKEDSQPALLFLQESAQDIKAKADHRNRVKSKELYKLYKVWAEETGRGRMNATNFGKAMARHCEKVKSSGVMTYDVGKWIEDEEEFPY